MVSAALAAPLELVAACPTVCFADDALDDALDDFLLCFFNVMVQIQSQPRLMLRSSCSCDPVRVQAVIRPPLLVTCLKRNSTTLEPQRSLNFCEADADCIYLLTCAVTQDLPVLQSEDEQPRNCSRPNLLVL